MDAVRNSGELTIRVWRGAEVGEFATYRVPARANQTVLDVVTEIQRHQAPDLAYRFACRVGVCGTCAMVVNGVPRWTCRTHVSRVVEGGADGGGALTVEPLHNLPRIRDLACDMAPFFDKWKAAGGRFEGGAARADLPAKVDSASAKRKAADAGIECINCAVCYAACDVVAGDAAYLGPAALLRAWTLVNDERHQGRRETVAKAMGRGGCGSCHSQGSCMAHCPVGLSPTEGIAGLKRMSLAAMFLRAP